MKEISKFKFQNGRLYLFTVDRRQSPQICHLIDADALYGVYYSRSDNDIVLEICSHDMLSFGCYITLPRRFGYVREGHASEYRDFFFNAGWNAAFVEINKKGACFTHR